MYVYVICQEESGMMHTKLLPAVTFGENERRDFGNGYLSYFVLDND